MRLLRLLSACLAFSVAGALPGAAHGPTPKKVEESIEIASTPAKVWEVAKDFAGIANWHPLVTASKGEGGNGADATREITLKSGGTLSDGLDEYSEEEMSYGYRLAKENVDVFPVSFYSASFDVDPGADGGSKVTWIGRFYRADTSNFPPEDKNDEAAIAAMTEFLQEGLKGLKAKAEAK